MIASSGAYPIRSAITPRAAGNIGTQAVQFNLEFANLSHLYRPLRPDLRARPGELKPWGFQLATNKVISVAAARTIFAQAHATNQKCSRYARFDGRPRRLSGTAGNPKPIPRRFPDLRHRPTAGVGPLRTIAVLRSG